MTTLRKASVTARWTGFIMLVLFILGMAAPAYASRDVVQFGSSIEVAKSASIHDAVCFFCSVHAEGDIDGDVVVFFGSAHLEGHAKHDVVVFFGNVQAADDASIGQNLVNIFGSTRLGEHVDVGRDAVVLFGALRMASTASIDGDRVVQPGWLFWLPFLLIAGGIGFLNRELRGLRRRRMLRGY